MYDQGGQIRSKRKGQKNTIVVIVPAEKTVLEVDGTETVEPITVYVVETAADLAALPYGYTPPEEPA